MCGSLMARPNVVMVLRKVPSSYGFGVRTGGFQHERAAHLGERSNVSDTVQLFVFGFSQKSGSEIVYTLALLSTEHLRCACSLPFPW